MPTPLNIADEILVDKTAHSMIRTTAPVCCGIYAIRNKVNQKLYVGSAKNIKIRIQNHTSKLKWGKHRNKKLQNAWNKYGMVSFDVYVLEEVACENLISKEQEYIDLFNCVVSGYNLAPEADRCLAVSGADNHKSIKVCQISLNGDFIASFDTITGAAITTGASRRGIYLACRSQGSSGGYRWCYAKDIDKNVGVQYKRFKKYTKGKPVVQFDKDGNEINRFDRASDAGRHLDIDGNMITQCCRGKMHSAGGFQWCYETDVNSVTGRKCIPGGGYGKRIGMFLKDGTLISVFNKMHEVTQMYGYDRPTIYDCLNGDRRSAYGKVWKYMDEEAA